MWRSPGHFLLIARYLLYVKLNILIKQNLCYWWSVMAGVNCTSVPLQCSPSPFRPSCLITTTPAQGTGYGNHLLPLLHARSEGEC